VILRQLKLTKLKLEVLKFDFQRKEERYEHIDKFAILTKFRSNSTSVQVCLYTGLNIADYVTAK